MTDSAASERDDEARPPMLHLVLDNNTVGAAADNWKDESTTDSEYGVDDSGVAETDDVEANVATTPDIGGPVELPKPHPTWHLPRDTRAGADALVTGAVNGDRNATGRLLAIIRPLVVKYCRGRIGRFERSAVSADDVAQEVCLAVLRALPTYQDQGRPFLAFVYGIAAHKIADAHRAAQRNRSDPYDEVPDAPALGVGPEQRALAEEQAARMSQLLGTLPAKQREILTLRIIVGLSADETAEMVDSTAGAVRVAQHRALSKLRGQIEGDPDF